MAGWIPPTLVYILILGGSLNLIPAVLGLACTGSRWYFPFLYLAVSTCASLFVAGFIVALYGLSWARLNRQDSLPLTKV